jgi:ABC-type transporter Mla subunit MlaD
MSDRPIQVIPAEEISRRFDKIEDKLDQLSEAMVTLARNEEKIIAIQSQVEHHSARLNRHSEKLDHVAEDTASNKRALASQTWLLRGIVMTIIGAAITMLMSM